MSDYEIHRLAQWEGNRATAYFRKAGLVSVSHFIACLAEVLDRVLTMPLTGSPFRKRYRFLKMKKYRYVVYYEIRKHEPVMIYAIAHTSRRLGYWLGRIRRP